MEAVISLVASLILALDAQEVRCGISLPGHVRPVCLSPEDPETDAAALLLALSEFQPEPKGRFDGEALGSLALTVGQLWLVTASGEKLGCPELLGCLAGAGVSVLCTEPGAPGPLAGHRMLPISAVRGGGE